VTARSVIARIRSLDPTARKIHQTGSHQEWRLVDGSIVMIPVHGGDVPLGTLRSIERQGERALRATWLLRAH